MSKRTKKCKAMKQSKNKCPDGKKKHPYKFFACMTNAQYDAMKAKYTKLLT